MYANAKEQLAKLQYAIHQARYNVAIANPPAVATYMADQCECIIAKPREQFMQCKKDAPSGVCV